MPEKKYSIYDYGYNSQLPALTPQQEIGRIIGVHRDRYEIGCDSGNVYARLKGRNFYLEVDSVFPTVGDFVLFIKNDHGDSIIYHVCERRSILVRKDPNPNKSEQMIAANFDYLMIATSLNHDFNIQRIGRYLSIANNSNAEPIILLTKCDLVTTIDDYVQAIRVHFRDIKVIPISTYTGYGFEELRAFVQPQKTFVFLGSSGVGKSSVINAIAGSEIMTTGDIRVGETMGRHTTTHRQLIMLDNGCMVIDTPGMRELGMWENADGIIQTFTDVNAYIQQCKYRDCTHRNEPGCAVKKAISQGDLEKEDLIAFEKLKKEEANWSARQNHKNQSKIKKAQKKAKPNRPRFNESSME